MRKKISFSSLLLVLIIAVVSLSLVISGCGGGGGGGRGGGNGGNDGDDGTGGGGKTPDIPGSPRPTPRAKPIGNVSGTVTDLLTGKPLRESVVAIGDSSVLTVSDGKYFLTGAQAGEEIIITASHKGYENSGKKITVVPNKTTTVDFQLLPLEEPEQAVGRYVTFESHASNLVPGDVNGVQDVFVHDTLKRITTRVSISSNGEQGNARSRKPVISGDGRYVVFYSEASNLVENDTNNAGDIFLHDRQTGETIRLSVTIDGVEGDLSSYDDPAISGDGKYVAFFSQATNLVPGDTNNAGDVFMYDTQNRTLEMVSVNADGVQGDRLSANAALSGDGQYVAFRSYATNLVPNDTNNQSDVFVRHIQTGVVTRISVSSGGVEGNGESDKPSVSGDGRYIAFWSASTNLVEGDTNNFQDLFIHDMQLGTTVRVSVNTNGTQGNGDSTFPAISDDGRIVAFYSTASTLATGDINQAGDIFVHDFTTGVTKQVSRSPGGAPGNGESYNPDITPDSMLVTYRSYASNIVKGDTNGFADVFVYDITKNTTMRVSVSSEGIQGNGNSFDPYIVYLVPWRSILPLARPVVLPGWVTTGTPRWIAPAVPLFSGVCPPMPE